MEEEPNEYRRNTLRIVGAIIVLALLIYLYIYDKQTQQFKDKCPLYRVHCVVFLEDPSQYEGR